MKSIVPVLQQAERSLSILVADDVEFNRSTLAMILDKLGHRAIFAENGLEAVECWRKGGIDTVLMDIQMPVMSGIEALAVIRQVHAASGQHTPVIALTADSFKGTKEKLLQAGFDAYLAKPFKISRLGELLDRFVQSGTDR